LHKVGVEPSGEAFNSISLEPDTGRPMNPMINAGAIATTGLVADKPDVTRMQRIMETFARYTGRKMDVDEKVYQSERETGHRNRAIAHLLYGHGILDREPEDVLDLYFRQCSILVTARDLAIMGACLANNGVNPVTSVAALNSSYVEKVLGVMSTCGMYDYSGGWIFDVGMPAKSGVGGGIMAVLPGQFGLGVFSPPLDKKGNSMRGIEACRRLSRKYDLHLFQVARSISASVVHQIYDSSKFASRRRRNQQESEVLSNDGQRIRIYELQGELLFGSAEAISLDILSAFADVEFIVVDLRRVFALDNASTLIFCGVCDRAVEQGIRLLFTNCRHLYRFRRDVEKQTSSTQEPGWLRYDDTDHAVQWCEDQLINAAAAACDVPVTCSDLREQYLCANLTDAELAFLRRVGKEQSFAAGVPIFLAGDPGNCLYFVYHGEVDVSIRGDSGNSVRITTIGAGMVFGEIALLNNQRRTANVTAAADTTCLEIQFDDLQDAIRHKMLINLASYLAAKVARDTELVKHLG
jgi:glutaminase